ncbi:MAG: hypothetical protein QW374_00170 [Candidatus Bathyarchaeia archaeon]|nr:hypothetical protein [Candidatus Bathyarchaeota archaeon]
MPRYCPLCGGRLVYDNSVKLYVCQSCGAMLTLEDIIRERDRIASLARGGDVRKRDAREYLRWWTSSKRQSEED